MRNYLPAVRHHAAVAHDQHHLVHHRRHLPHPCRAPPVRVDSFEAVVGQPDFRDRGLRRRGDGGGRTAHDALALARGLWPGDPPAAHPGGHGGGFTGMVHPLLLAGGKDVAGMDDHRHACPCAGPDLHAHPQPQLQVHHRPAGIPCLGRNHRRGRR